MKISKQAYIEAEMQLNKILAVVSQKGGFEKLSKAEEAELEKNTEIVKLFEEQNYTISMPETFQGILELKMFEQKLKQKDLARILETSSTQLSEIIHKKRKPSVALLKSMNQKLGIDGNLLLRLV
jgi:HTH-type transcriptional regulator / antitoxin HigA